MRSAWVEFKFTIHIRKGKPISLYEKGLLFAIINLLM